MSSDSPQSDFARLPEELPPVEPPSAGFIAKLFLVPALIVAMVIGVWLLVSRMASVEQDWRSLVTDIQSPQDHIRSRGIFGLAQQLAAEQGAAHVGPKLSENPEVAQQLADYLVKELKRPTADESSIKQQAILARTLGLFHLPDIVLPALAKATEADHELEVRKNALGSVAVLAGRAAEENQPLNLDLIQPAVLEASADSAPLIRQLAAFILGLMPGEASQKRLLVLLEDSRDESTRVNAAIALARQDSIAGFPVFLQIVKTSLENPALPSSAEEFTQFAEVKNSLLALQKVSSKLSDKQRAELKPLLEKMSQTYREPKLRIEAASLLKSLGEKG